MTLEEPHPVAGAGVLKPPEHVLGYIAGTAFCGSTLTSFLLNAQPSVACIGEVAFSVPRRHPESYPCSCGATIGACEFWREVSREMSLRGYEFNPGNWSTEFSISRSRLLQRIAVRPLGSNRADRLRDGVVRRTGWGSRLSEIGRRNAALFDSIRAIKRAAIFVDASKDPARVRLLREYSTIQPYVIHLVRDPLAFVNSFMKNSKQQSLSEGVHWWKRTIWQMERLRAVTPGDRWLLVRYEDLCANPERELRRVLTFLGANDVGINLDFREAPHHIIGNRMRLGASADIRLDRSWRDELSREQVDQIKAMTAKHRTLLEYDDR